MDLRRSPIYDSQEFRDDWYSMKTVREIAEKYGLSSENVFGAARRRGFTHRSFIPSRTCSMPDCDRPRRRKGMCTTHYYRQRRNEDMTKPIRGYRHAN